MTKGPFPRFVECAVAPSRLLGFGVERHDSEVEVVIYDVVKSVINRLAESICDVCFTPQSGDLSASQGKETDGR
jgi:hypothetical protein